jgi:regulation of enolase protein 1 (concanavalin A-like superfamily)
VVAAPAPVYKPKPMLGMHGWDGPADPLGGTQFDFAGDELTMTVPGGTRRILNFPQGPTDGPHLLRDVEGDFVLQVRVGGDVRTAPDEDRHAAGIVLRAGKAGCTVARGNWVFTGKGKTEEGFYGVVRRRGPTDEVVFSTLLIPRPKEGGTAYLRLTRRGNQVALSASEDGAIWRSVFDTKEDLPDLKVELPRKVKVGVFTETSGEASFRAFFDRFELKPLK